MSLRHMDAGILKRVGAVLLAVGLIDTVITIERFATTGPYPAAFDATAIVAGIILFRGGPRAALWVRTLAIFLLAASIALVIAAPFYQPVDLTLTESRLDPAAVIAKAVPVLVVLLLSLWVSRELGRQPIQDAIVSAGIRRWDMRIPAQAGAGLVVLVSLLLWLALHGQSAQLAESLALQQLGPDYRYHLSRISSGGNGHGTSVSGVVIAWNDKEIKTVLLHWETK
jgi:hypothetical protein